jgi:hypothetical protein
MSQRWEAVKRRTIVFFTAKTPRYAKVDKIFIV